MSEKLKTHELISEVRNRGLRPNQLFTETELLADEKFKKAVDGEVDYQIWLRDREAEEELNSEMDKEIDKAKKKKDEMIPGEDDSKEPKDKKEKENPFIPGPGENNGNDDLVPD